MALIKAKDYKGIEVTYWKISSIIINYLESTTKINLSGYLNKDVRLEDVNNCILFDTIVAEGLYETREAQYARIKLEERFIDAVDDLEVPQA